ncbi:hypothetical protein OF846_001740 [Rhodotorula toruloides]|nr:hypothetical protein OF846_001740 [Rhodotorula toruloides]
MATRARDPATPKQSPPFDVSTHEFTTAGEDGRRVNAHTPSKNTVANRSTPPARLMASRGGRGGGRGGRGGGASGKPQPPMGHLQFNEIMEHSKKQLADVLYPPYEDFPDTEYPTEREARIAKRYNDMLAEMKYTPFFIEAPTRASTDIERWSDRFKPKTASAATATAALRTLHSARQYDKDLLPPSAFEAVFERKAKGKTAKSAGKSADAKGILEGDDDALGEDEEDEEADEDELIEEDEDDEGDNDYEMDYFDNGEEDDFDNLGGGGGGDDANPPLTSSSLDIVIPASHWSGTPSVSPSKRRKGKGRADDRRESVLSERDANEGLLVDVQSASGLTPAANKTLFPPRTPSAFALSLLDKSPSLLKAQLSTPLIPLGTPITVRKKVHPPSEQKENETPSTRRSARRTGPNSPSPAGTAASSPVKNAPSSPKSVRYSPSPRRLRSSPRKPAAQTPLATSSTPSISSSPSPAPTPSTPIHHLGLVPTTLSVSPFAHFSPSTPAIRTHASYREEELTDCDADGSYWDADEDTSLSYGPTESVDSTELVQGGEVEADEVDAEMAVAVGRLTLDAPVAENMDEVTDESVDLTPTEVEDNDGTASDGEDADSATSAEEIEVAAVLDDEEPAGIKVGPEDELVPAPNTLEAEAIERMKLVEVDSATTPLDAEAAVDTLESCDDVVNETPERPTLVEEDAVSNVEAIEEPSLAETPDSPVVAVVELEAPAPPMVEAGVVDEGEPRLTREEAASPSVEQEVLTEEAPVAPPAPSPSLAEPVPSLDELEEPASDIDALDGLHLATEPASLDESPTLSEPPVGQPDAGSEAAPLVIASLDDVLPAATLEATAATPPAAPRPALASTTPTRPPPSALRQPAQLTSTAAPTAKRQLTKLTSTAAQRPVPSLAGKTKLTALVPGSAATARWYSHDHWTDAESRQPACEACGHSPSLVCPVVVDIVHSLKQLEHIGAALASHCPACSAFDRDSRDKLVQRESASEYRPLWLFASATDCTNRHDCATYDYRPSSPLPATHRSAPYGSRSTRISPRSFPTSLSLTTATGYKLVSLYRPYSDFFVTACPLKPRAGYSPSLYLVRLEHGSASDNARKAAEASSTPLLNSSAASPSIRRAGRIVDGKLEVPRTPAVPPTPTPAALPPKETPPFPPRPATPTQPDVPALIIAPTPTASPSPARASPRRLAASFAPVSPHRSPRRILVDQPTPSTENPPPTPSTALLAPAEKLAASVPTTIFEPSARPASMRATRRTRLAEVQATVPPSTDAPDAVAELPTTLRSSRRTIAPTVAPVQPEAATEPAALVQPKTPILRTRRSRLRLLTEEAANAAAEPSAEPEPTVVSPPAPVEDAQPATTRPLSSFRPAPAVTQDELNRLTQRNTKKNQVAFNRIKLETVFLDCARPPSPTSKIRKAFGSEGSLARTTTKEGREARAAKRRNALRSSLDGSELAALAEELKAESGSSMEAEPPKQHFRAAGDDEQYFTPQKAGGAWKSAAVGRKRSPGSGSSSASASPRRQETKRVKWDRALVYEGPLDRDARSNGDSILKPVDLDAWGNSTSIASLGKPTSITIRMRVFKDEQ